MARLIDIPPARQIGVLRSSVGGRVQLAGSGSLSSESTLEHDLIVALDFRPEVTAIREQPFTLSFEHEGRSCRYTPDLMAEIRFDQGPTRTIVYEVKPSAVLRSSWSELRPKLRAARRYCRQNGWEFRLMDESRIRTPFLANAKFLRAYLHLPANDYLERLREELWMNLKALGRTTPKTLLKISYWNDETRMAALPVLWNMVATRQIGANLYSPLTMSTTIWRWNA